LHFRADNLEVNWPFAVIDDLATDLILGVDFQQKYMHSIDPGTGDVKWKQEPPSEAKLGLLHPKRVTTITHTHATSVIAKLDDEHKSYSGPVLATLPHDRGNEHVLLVATEGCVQVPLRSQYAEETLVTPDDLVGCYEVITPDDVVGAVAGIHRKKEASPDSQCPPELLPQIKIAVEKAQMEKKSELERLLRFHHKALARNKEDLGRTAAIPHQVFPKDNKPVYSKQWPIPAAHKPFIEQEIARLLRLKCIQYDYSSPHNSPIFAVKKPHSDELRLVQDLRRQNENLHDDFHSFRDVQTCLTELGGLEAKYFATLDLQAGYWQLELDEASRPFTAFTVPGKGKFSWTVSPMGLHSSPAAFSRLMKFVFRTVPKSITYLDDVIIGGSSEEELLENLKRALEQLEKFNLKLNVKKCFFGQKSVTYLGYTIAKGTITPGKEKSQAIREFPAPTSVPAIRRFHGLANYFRQFIPNFAQHAGQLTGLIKKTSGWTGGTLPPNAAAAFEHLRTKLSEFPVMHMPRPDRPFHLLTDGSLDGFGACLLQKHDDGDMRVIAFASRTLKPHEKNYSAFLLEMAAAVFGIEHFHVYLYDAPFTLFMDHKPMEKLGKVHTRTLHRLQELMSRYNFQLQYRPGKDNVIADALSRAPIFQTAAAIAAADNIASRTERDELVKWLRLTPRQPLPQTLKQYAPFATRLQLRDGNVYFKVTPAAPARQFVMQNERAKLIQEAHASRFAAHGGIHKTLHRLGSCYWWPDMASDVSEFIRSCSTCQEAKSQLTKPAPLQPLPVANGPNDRIHVDLMSFPRVSARGNKYVLVITDAFTKYVELVPLPNKEALTVASAIFNRWICRFTVPRTILSDGGKEFVNSLTTELYQLLGIHRTTTSAIHPQTNAQCERFNRTCWGILRCLLEDPDSEDWEAVLPLVALVYNTSLHQATKNSPFFLTFVRHPRLPYFDVEQFAQNATTHSWPHHAARAWSRVAQQTEVNLHRNRDTMQRAYNVRASPDLPTYEAGQHVYVHFPTTALSAKNAKFARPWLEFIVEKQVSPTTYAVRKLSANGAAGRRSIVHCNRMKAKIAQGRKIYRSAPAMHFSHSQPARSFADPPSREDGLKGEDDFFEDTVVLKPTGNEDHPQEGEHPQEGDHPQEGEQPRDEEQDDGEHHLPQPQEGQDDGDQNQPRRPGRRPEDPEQDRPPPLPPKTRAHTRSRGTVPNIPLPPIDPLRLARRQQKAKEKEEARGRREESK